ncbi:Ester hydrolase [Oopsacas minuta]|uniref:Ester hydrolase n=1 Tax=Oopsacas minuta TaxID=111878 RepID=A0AAV7JCQ7_9METZ|nr:Ester hydrolase [Oopsacas minuta]
MATGCLHKCFPLHLPPLLEIKEVIETAMKPQYKELSVEVCDCPDLTQMPWDMACGGLGGDTATFHFGGVPYLLPVPDKSKVYDMQEIINITGVKNPFVIGPGAASREQVGINSELIANLRVGEVPVNKSRASKIEAGNCKLEMYPSTKTGPIADLFVSEGTPGPVLKIHAKQRLGK